jgi:anaerobic magnesium-protoporphyrin IX monomethyl ester cyclase
MRFLLLNMPVAFNKWQNLEMPLGMGYIASSLINSGHEVAAKDFEVEHFSKEELSAVIARFRPQAVGISFRTASYASAVECAKILRSISPDIAIICGGHHSTVFSADVIKDLNCSYVVRGEGEETIVSLAEALQNKTGLDKVEGISYKKDDSIFHNKDRNQIQSLDRLSFPAWHLLPMSKYSIHSLITSRGCPFSCIYCDKSISTRQVRYRSAANVYEEISSLGKTYGYKSFYFVDDFLLQNKKRLYELFDRITPMGLKWRCQSRADAIDEELVKKAGSAGCQSIIFGLETGDEEELKFIRKGNSIAESRKAVELAAQAGINVRANFMLGFPISTEKSVMSTITFAASLPIDNCRFFLVTPLPNTELWDYTYKNGLIDKDTDWKAFDLYSSSYRIPNISADDLVCYAGAAYMHVLKKKVLIENTIQLPRNLARLIVKIARTRRIRGNISPIFSSSVNLALEIWFLIRNKDQMTRLRYLWNMIRFENMITRYAKNAVK